MVECPRVEYHVEAGIKKCPTLSAGANIHCRPSPPDPQIRFKIIVVNGAQQPPIGGCATTSESSLSW